MALGVIEFMLFLYTMEFAIAFGVGMVKREFLISSLLSLVPLAISPVLIYGIPRLDLALTGYLVSFGGWFLLASGILANAFGWMLGIKAAGTYQVRDEQPEVRLTQA